MPRLTRPAAFKGLPQRLNGDEAAAFIGVAPSTLNAWNYRGYPNVPSFKLGRKRVYDRDELAAWMETRRTGSAA